MAKHTLTSILIDRNTKTEVERFTYEHKLNTNSFINDAVLKALEEAKAAQRPAVEVHELKVGGQ
jgi:hypothetical protein